MQIFFQRTGGFAGLRMSGTVDVDDLPDEDAKKIYKLLDKIDFFDLPAHLKNKDEEQRDQFNYTITIEGKKGRHSIQFTQPNSKELGELTDFLSRLLRRNARRS